MNKLVALFTTGSGWALVLVFVYGGLQALAQHTAGNVQIDITMILSLIGIIWHPTNMVGGRSK